MLNYPIEVLESTIAGKNKTCIIFPSYRSKEVTARTILSLIATNRQTDYDVILVDNCGYDHEYVMEKVREQGFNDLYYMVLKHNVGGSGAIYAGQKACFENGYEYFLLSDNDAELITEEGISLLLEALQRYELVLPTNVDDKNREDEDRSLEFYGLIHYLTLSRQAIQKLGFINPDYFLNMEDLDYVARANTMKMRVGMVHDCLYFHPFRKISLFYNPNVYFTVRNHLLFIFRNPNRVALKYRMMSLKFLLTYLVMKCMHLFQTRDTSIARTIFLAFRDFLAGRITAEPPANGFRFVRVEPEKGSKDRRYSDLAADKNRVFIRKRYFAAGDERETKSFYLLQRSGVKYLTM